MRVIAALSIMLSACGFSVSAGNPGGGDDGTAMPDASPDGATAVDADPTPHNLPLYAVSNQMLYRLDLDAHTSVAVGPMTATGSSINIDGLALLGNDLIAISDGGDKLLTIDRTTAAVTKSVTLAPVGAWGGLTVIPAGDLDTKPVVLAGKANDGKLYRIDPSTGAVSMIGSFTQGLDFFSDLAWVHGIGLFATLQGSPCTDVCFAKIDPATGAATTFRTNLGANLYGMSGYRGTLWAFNSAGPVLSVSQSNGLMTIEMDPMIPWTEAAQ